MNFQEAKKIFIGYGEQEKDVANVPLEEFIPTIDYKMANGYIQAIHGPEVKILLDALEYYQEKDNVVEKSFPGVVVPKAHQALAMFKAIVNI